MSTALRDATRAAETLAFIDGAYELRNVCVTLKPGQPRTLIAKLNSQSAAASSAATVACHI
jgi:hypothetical protein